MSRRSRAPAAAGAVAELLRRVEDGRRPSARAGARMPGEIGAPATRSAALAAVERLRTIHLVGDRLHEIVARCDLGGEMHKVVAADLGLSRRQFYRDLSFARAFVGREVGAAAAGPDESPADGDPRLQTAIALASSGHAKAAVEHFAPVVASLDGNDAVWGHSVLADLLLDDGDIRSARRELRAALAPGDDPSAERAYALLTQAKLLHQTGRASEAAIALEALIARVTAAGATRSRLATDTLSEALTLLAFCYHERGDFAAATATGARNPAAINAARVSSSALRQYLNVSAMLACDDDAGPRTARRACDRFYRFAAAHGFVDDISAALLQMGGIARFERRLDDAETFARRSLSIQRAIGASCAPVLGMLTALAIDRGAFRRAVALAREMRAAAAAGSHAWWGAHLHEAEALACSREHAAASRICTIVARGEGDRDARIAAWRRRVEATIFEGLGDADAAYLAAGTSLEILGTDAPPFHRLKSLLLAQQLRPNRSRRAQMRSLAAVLGWHADPPEGAVGPYGLADA